MKMKQNPAYRMVFLITEKLSSFMHLLGSVNE